MKKIIRIIPRLDIKGPNVVKGIHLEGLRVLGKPHQFASYYYKHGADELIYMDTVASLYERNSLLSIIKKTAEEIFIPLTVGGGLRSIQDIREVLLAGADKVSLNTAAIRRPDLIENSSRIFGSSTIVVAIEAIKQPSGEYFAFIDNGREYTGIEVLEWAQRVEKLGAGEIMLTSVDRDGTGLGFDLKLIRKVTEVVSIPVIAHGGAGKIEHIKRVIIEGKTDGAALGSILHYDFVKQVSQDIDTSKEGNYEFMKSDRNFNIIEPACLEKIKEYLNRQGINCRN